MSNPDFKVTKDILATSGQRLANLFLDRLFFTILTAVYGVFLGFLSYFLNNNEILNITQSDVTSVLISLLFYFVMYFILEASKQRTLGKYISKTMVVMEDGSKPSTNTIAIRTLCRFIPFEPFSFLGSDARGWHDTLSNTYVVDVEKFKNKQAITLEFDDLGKPEDEVVF